MVRPRRARDGALTKRSIGDPSKSDEVVRLGSAPQIAVEPQQVEPHAMSSLRRQSS